MVSGSPQSWTGKTEKQETAGSGQDLRISHSIIPLPPPPPHLIPQPPTPKIQSFLQLVDPVHAHLFSPLWLYFLFLHVGGIRIEFIGIYSWVFAFTLSNLSSFFPSRHQLAGLHHGWQAPFFPFYSPFPRSFSSAIGWRDNSNLWKPGSSLFAISSPGNLALHMKILINEWSGSNLHIQWQWIQSGIG